MELVTSDAYGATDPWPEVVLGDVVRFLRRGIHSRAQLGVDGPVRNLHYGDIHNSARAHLDSRTLSDLPTLTEKQADGLDRLADGDLILADASEDLDGVAKAIEVLNMGDLYVVAGQHTIAARFDNSVLVDGFKGYLPFVPDFRSQIRRLAAGTKVFGITRSHISTIQLRIPPPHEQQAIASALGDIDELIAQLDQLVAKKRDLRIAMMQQLLTGRTRLPGFGANWTERVLGDHVRFLKNGVNPRSDLHTTGPVRYLHYGDVHTAQALYLDLRTADLPRLPEDKAQRLDHLEDGDLVFVDASEDLSGVGKSVEVVGASGTELVSGLHTIAARFDDRILANGFKAYLQFCPLFRDQLARLAQGTKVLATNRRHIESVTMPLPPVDEQVAIAKVLSDCAEEILAIEELRQKTAGLKIAALQTLLTGKTRLVPSEASNG